MIQKTREQLLLLFVEGLYSLVNRTGSPQGFSLNQILQKLNTIQHMHSLQTYQHNPKVSLFGIALIKNGK